MENGMGEDDEKGLGVVTDLYRYRIYRNIP